MTILVADVLTLTEGAVMVVGRVHVGTILQTLTSFSALEQWAKQVPIHHNAHWAEKYLTINGTQYHLIAQIFAYLTFLIFCLSLSLETCR